MQLPAFVCHVIPAHVAYACLVQFSCTCLVHVLCAIALHPRWSHTLKIFCPITQTMILVLQRVGFGREEVMTLFLFRGGI